MCERENCGENVRDEEEANMNEDVDEEMDGEGEDDSATVETALGFLVTPSGYASDGVRILVRASERNRLKEALEDSAERRRRSYKATP
nr:hypothetical protein [Tanacetum cinerariifolium]